MSGVGSPSATPPSDPTIDDISSTAKSTSDIPLLCGHCVTLREDPKRKVCDHFILLDKFAAPIPHRESSPELLSDRLVATSEELYSMTGQREITKLRHTLLVLSHKQNHLQRQLNEFRGQQIEIADREYWNFDACQALLQMSEVVGGIPFTKSSGMMKKEVSVRGGKGKEKESVVDAQFIMPKVRGREGRRMPVHPLFIIMT